MSGYIPKKYIFFCQREYPREAIDGKTYNVTPTYLVEDKKGNKKQIENAKRWASEVIRRNGSSEIIDGKQIDFENKGFDSVRIIELDIRGKGGRAYKVLVNEKFYFDMREPDLLEIIGKYGIEAGGLLKGKYVLLKEDRRNRIINIESDIYKKSLEQTKKESVKPISLKELVIGGIYQNPNSTQYVYFGRASRLKIEYYRQSCYNNKVKLKIKKISISKNKTIWVPKSVLKENLNHEDILYLTSQKFTEKVGEIKIPSFSIKNLRNDFFTKKNIEKSTYGLLYKFNSFYFDTKEEIGLTKKQVDFIKRSFNENNLYDIYFEKFNDIIIKERPIIRKVKQL